MQRSIRWRIILLSTSFAVLTGAGCVRRTLTIQTEPSGAIVRLNDREIGRSSVTVDFVWYGDYDVLIRKEGYKTLQTNWVIPTPWYQHPPFDFFAEILWPGRIVDAHTRTFQLEPETPPTPQELQERAMQTRSEALGLKPADTSPEP